MAKSLFLVASLFLLLPLSFTVSDRKTAMKEAVVGKQPKVGEYKVIENINYSYIQHLRNYEMAQYYNKTGSHLQFEKVICGEYQIVQGTNYGFLLIALDVHISWVYEGLIFVDLEENRTLNDFFKINLKN